MTTQEVYIHLGLPKTASTFVQEELFPKLDGIRYYRKRQYSLELAAGSHLTPVLLTCEKDSELLEELERIYARIPQAKIIVVFREPFSWLVSKYKYSIRKHGTLSFGPYLNDELRANQGIGPGFYAKILDALEEKFSGRYLVLNYNDLRKDRDEFAAKIARFTHSRLKGELLTKTVKPAFREKQLVMLLKLNKAYPYCASVSRFRFVRFLHYKYREFLLHIAAFLSLLVPGRTDGFKEEIESSKNEVAAAWADDWQRVLAKTSE